MAILQLLLNDFCDIWRSVSEPKAKPDSWSNQWTNATRILEAYARTVGEHTCSYGLDSTLRNVVQPVSAEHISQTNALLFRETTETRQRETELLVLLDPRALLAVHKACWAEVQKFFHPESASGDDAAFNYECAAEYVREIRESNLTLKSVADETKRLIL